MDLIKEIKLWRGIGHILNTKIGSSSTVVAANGNGTWHLKGLSL